MRGRGLHSWLAAMGLALLMVLAPRAGVAEPSADAALSSIDRHIAAWDLNAARREIAALPDGPVRQLREGIVAIYEGRYTDAEERLAAVLAAGQLPDGSRELERTREYLALARGSLRALGQAQHLRSPDGHVEIVLADERDAILAPYLFDAMAEARRLLGQELGVIPDHTVRFEILDDPAKLAMVTPLTLDNIRTTGTVGITKYRRVVMITPRVMVYGYGWLDTAVHEYVHYLLTIRTRNNAPVWLQEGMAKLLEARWRRPDRAPLDPPVAAILRKAIVEDDLVTFQEMYPSVAMLPTQERAALAYAEAETMLDLLRVRRGPAAIETLLDAVADGEDAEAALAQAWGGSFEQFMGAWKNAMLQETRGSKGGALGGPEFADESYDPMQDPEMLGDVFSHLGGGRGRQHARLGQLLELRGHLDAAAQQYEKARKADKKVRRDPTLSRRLGEVYLELRRFEKAAELLAIAAADDPENANIASSQARALLRSGDREGAESAAARAVRNNPLIPWLHCDLAELAADPDRATFERDHCRE